MSITEKQIDIETGDKIVGKGIRFERIRRITGYLVGTMNRWNNAKRAEERDRVKHVSVRQV
jgi:anaerobic ribonucleoside-triphosphate reductase